MDQIYQLPHQVYQAFVIELHSKSWIFFLVGYLSMVILNPRSYNGIYRFIAPLYLALSATLFVWTIAGSIILSTYAPSLRSDGLYLFVTIWLFIVFIPLLGFGLYQVFIFFKSHYPDFSHTGTVYSAMQNAPSSSPAQLHVQQETDTVQKSAQEMSPEVTRGFAITALVLAVLSIFIPVYGVHISGLALICACIGAWGGDRTFAIAASLITFVNVFFLSPSLELMFYHLPGSKPIFLIFAALCIAAPLFIMGYRTKRL